MSDATRPVFRPEAIARYAQRRDKTVIAEPVVPPTALCLAVLLGLLALGFGLAWFARVPEYVSGVAVQGSWRDSGSSAVVLLPPESLARLSRGQRVLFLDADSIASRAGRIDEVEPRVMTMDEIRRSLPRVSALAARELMGTAERPAAAVVIIRSSSADSGMSDLSSDGAVRARVEVGSSRLLALLVRTAGAFGQ